MLTIDNGLNIYYIYIQSYLHSVLSTPCTKKKKKKTGIKFLTILLLTYENHEKICLTAWWYSLDGLAA
jgi:hypothetical protein